MWGRTGMGSGASAAYLVRGREPMELRCYDRAFGFQGAAVEILDAWFGDVTRDSEPDLLLFARDDSPTNAYLIHLYPGVTGGGVAPSPLVRSGSRNTFSSDIGMSLFDPYPAYVTAWTSTEEAGVVFGGIYAPFGALVYDPVQGALSAPSVAQDTTANSSLTFADAVQDMIPYTGTDPHRLLVVTNQHVYAMHHTAGSADEFTKLTTDGVLTNNLPRFVRAWRKLYGDSELVAATQAQNGWDLITYDGSDARVRFLSADDDLIGRTSEDLAFGDLDGNSALDMVALVSNNSSAELLVYRNLSFGSTTVTIPSAPEKITLPKGKNVLAVGDFDGVPTTPEDILVLQTSVSGQLGSCVRYRAASSCLVACGSTTCL